MDASPTVGAKAWLQDLLSSRDVGYQYYGEWNNMKRQTILKYSCCDLCGGTLIWLKATPSFMLWRKRPCQTEAQNNGGQPRGNRAICMQLFAVSRTTKANQRILNGGWQASANAFALCLCQPSPLCLPSQSGPCFVFFSGRAFLNFFFSLSVLMPWPLKG